MKKWLNGQKEERKKKKRRQSQRHNELGFDLKRNTYTHKKKKTDKMDKVGWKRERKKEEERKMTTKRKR